MLQKLSVISLSLLPLLAMAQSNDSSNAIEQRVIDDVKRQIEEVTKIDPILSVTTGDISYDVDSQVLTVSDMQISSTDQQRPLHVIFDQIKGTQPPKQAGQTDDMIIIPDNGFITINGMHVDVDTLLQTALSDPSNTDDTEGIKQAKVYFDYFKGDDSFISSDMGMQYSRTEADGMIFKMQLAVENVGQMTMDMDMSGVYMLNGKSANDQNLPMMAMGVFGIKKLDVGFTSTGINAFFDYVLENETDHNGEKYNKENILFKLRQEVASLLKRNDLSLSDKYRFEFSRAILIALTSNQEINMSLKMSNMNIGTVMGLMGTSTEAEQVQYLKDVFGVSLNFSAVN